MIRISSFAKAKSNGGGNSNASSGGIAVPTVIMKKTPNVRIWGQWHDHTGDVNGDMTVEGKIDATGDITTKESIIGKKGNFEEVTTTNLSSDLIGATNITTDNIFCKSGNFSNLTSNNVNTDFIQAEDGVIDNLSGTDAKFHNLTVTGKAHFFELVIDKISASGGAVIFSPADGFQIDKIKWEATNSFDGNPEIPASFTLPINFHLIEWGSANYERDEITCNGVTYQSLVVMGYNTGKTRYHFFPKTNELIPEGDLLQYKFPDLYDEYEVVETEVPKKADDIYNYEYKIVEEDSGDFLFNMSYPDGVMMTDYKKMIASVYGHTIEGDEYPVAHIAYTKVYKDDKPTLWFYEQNEFHDDPFYYFGNYINTYQSYKRTYSVTIKNTGYGKGFLTLTPTVYFQATDADGKAIKNEWVINDQAICRTFNQAVSGYNQNVKNKYYWTVVKNVGTDYRCIEPIMIYNDGAASNMVWDDKQPLVYHFLTFNPLLHDGDLDCEVGDAIAMLGNRKDVDRQKAIYISAYTSLDPSLKAPFIAQYAGINSFSLDGKKTTWFAANGNKIKGDLCVESGKSVEDLINEGNNGIKQDIQDLINKYDNWINNVEQGSYLKVLPTTKDVKNTYQGWRNAIGSEIVFNTTTDQNNKVAGTDKTYFPDIKVGDKVAVEVTVNQTYDSNIQPNKATILGTVTRCMGMNEMTNPNITEWRTTVKVEYLIDTDLSGVWYGMSQLKVEQDAIKLSVTNLGTELTDKINQGIAQFEIRAGQIQSLVDNLQGDVSKITQQADNIQLQVNELAIKIDGERGKIVLDGDTEVNGCVQVKKDGVGFSLMGSNGEKFDILSKSIGTYKSFSEQSENMLVGQGVNKSVSVTAVMEQSLSDGSQTQWRKEETIEILGLIDLGYLKAGKNIRIADMAISKSIYVSVTPKNSNLVGGSARYVDFKVDVIGPDGMQKMQSDPCSDKLNGEAMNYTTVEAGNHKLKVRINVWITATLKKATQSGTQLTPQPVSCTTTASLRKEDVTFKYYVSNDAYGRIAYDGIGINFGAGNVLYMSDESTIIKYGPNYGLKITTNGIEKLVPTTGLGMGAIINNVYEPQKLSTKYQNAGSWTNINALNTVNYSSSNSGNLMRNGSLYLLSTDEFVTLYFNTVINVVLPHVSVVPIGHKIIIKRIHNNNSSYKRDVTISAPDKIYNAVGDLVDSYKINGNTVYVISNGTTWIMGFCG